MTPERWQQIDELFHAALACEPSQRMQLLANACGGDESLRLEVETLISFHEDTQSFIETPAGDVAAEMLWTQESLYEPGQQIGNYKIVRQLGSGGMGVVFLADDIRLNRKIALKLLPAQFTTNADRVSRFEREARAASALNHPNIVTIYEIGQSNSAHFIATEFVDGKTLRQLLDEKPFTLKEVLNVAIQVAGALNGAHAAGIVHRDIKPENIMIRGDGYVKILDFGLAKLTEVQTIESESETPTLLQSNPGIVMGTVQYMSPEQARAKNVDVRTDIWSLGVVLYELLTGRVPFSGETPSHVMVSLMEDDVPSLTGYTNVPAELGRIVTKALRKDQKERYQTASEMVRDLRSLKEELQLEARLKVLLEAVPNSKERITKSDGRRLERVRTSATRSVDTGVAPSASSAEYLVSDVKRYRFLAIGALVILLGGAIGLIYLTRGRNKTSLSASQGVTASKRGTNNDEAYRLYLQGKNLTAKRSSADAGKGIEYLERATRLDPKFALAYAEMARAYVASGLLGGGLPSEEYQKAREAVNNALALDPDLAEGYRVRGDVYFFEWDFAAAERDWLRARELEPNSTSPDEYPAYLAARGRFDEAITTIENMLEADPNSRMLLRDRGRILLLARRYDEAIVQLKRVIELDENFASPYGLLWLAYEMKGDDSGAYEWFMKNQQRTNSKHVELFQKAYQTSGWQGVRRKKLELDKLGEDDPGSNLYVIARQCALLGEKEQAFEYLNKAFEKRHGQMVMLNIDPSFDSLRSDQRLDAMVRRVGLR